jgi:DNA-binding NarL/FixJ family response regulator
MPVLDGMEAAQEILHKNSRAKILFLTVHSDPALVQRGLMIGGSGYVLKLYAGDELIGAIRAVLEGRSYVSPAVQ